MTMDEARAIIREKAPETEKTFMAICENRYCHPVRDWAIYDIAKANGVSQCAAKHRYNRHLKTASMGSDPMDVFKPHGF